MRNYLLFTSAGDNTEFYNHWFDKSTERLFDVFIVYYGNSQENYEKYKQYSNYIYKSKGSKFQNFYKTFRLYSKLLQQYSYFFIVDDDIQINCQEINLLFTTTQKYNLLISQPSFHPNSKLDYHQLVQNKQYILRYTDF